MRKFKSLIMLGVMFLGMFSFTGCSLFNNNQNPEKFSYTRLEALEDTIEPLVSDYFNENMALKLLSLIKGLQEVFF